MWNSQRIKELRSRLGLSQSDLAELLGCRQQTISEWETGLYTPGNAYSKLLDMAQMRSGPHAYQSRVDSQVASSSGYSAWVAPKREYEIQSRSDFNFEID